MARITITLSAEAVENLEKIKMEISRQYGGGRVTPGFAIGAALKAYVEGNGLSEEKSDKE